MVDSLVPLALIGSALVYALGAQRALGGAVSSRQVVAFAAAFAVLLGALAPPFDHLADTSLPAHMLQHILLLSVAPPLLAVAAPLAVAALALPPRHRRPAQHALHRIARSQARAWVVWTAVAFVLFTAVLGAWHLPPLYDAAVRHDSLHAIEHFSFVLAATFFWWLVLVAGRPDRRGLGVLAVFLLSLPATALGLLMTVASTSWYAPYGHGRDAVVDQQVAGALMWALGGLALVVTAASLFAAWMIGMERRDEHTSLGVPPPW